MNRKPYVPQKGIKRNPITVTLGKYGDCQLDGFTPRMYKGRNVIPTTKRINGQTLYVDLGAHPDIAEIIKAANEQYEQEFEARYPGIYELVAAIDDADYRYERLQREIERGDGILSNSTPERDPDEVARQYPIAAAYLDILAYCDSSNLDKYSSGQWAVRQIEDGADVIETRDQMRERWHLAAEKAVWNN